MINATFIQLSFEHTVRLGLKCPHLHHQLQAHVVFCLYSACVIEWGTQSSFQNMCCFHDPFFDRRLGDVQVKRRACFTWPSFFGCKCQCAWMHCCLFICSVCGRIVTLLLCICCNNLKKKLLQTLAFKFACLPNYQQVHLVTIPVVIMPAHIFRDTWCLMIISFDWWFTLLFRSVSLSHPELIVKNEGDE